MDVKNKSQIRIFFMVKQKYFINFYMFNNENSEEHNHFTEVVLLSSCIAR